MVDAGIFRGFEGGRRSWWLCCGCGLCIGLKLGLGREDLLLGDLEGPVGWVRRGVIVWKKSIQAYRDIFFDLDAAHGQGYEIEEMCSEVYGEMAELWVL